MSAKKTVRHIQNNFRLTTKLLSDSNILPVSKVLLKNNFPTYELPLHNPNSRPKKKKANIDCPPCPPIERDCPEPENNYAGQTSYLHPRSRLYPNSKLNPRSKLYPRSKWEAKKKEINEYFEKLENEKQEVELGFDPKKAALLADFFSKFESGQLSKSKDNNENSRSKYSFGNPRKSSQSKRHTPTIQSSAIFGQQELEESAYIDDDGNYIPEKKKFNPLTEYKSECEFDTIEFADLIRKNILTQNSKIDNRRINSFFESTYINLKSEKFIKEIQESIELALVKHCRQIFFEKIIDLKYEKRKEVANELHKKIFDRILDTYNNQPVLNVRTSESVQNQAYSTPIPLGYLISFYLGLYEQQNRSVFEPCAGNGSLLIAAHLDNVTANELHPIRVKHLESHGFRVEPGNALDYTPNRKFARIVMNPPFGVYPANKHIKINGKAITQIDQAIAIHSLQYLEPNGIAAIILGGHTLTKDPRGGFKSTDQFFHNHLYRNYDILKCIDINGDLYRKQGTSFDIRLIILRNSNTQEYKHILPYQYGNQPGQVLKANTWEDLYNFLSPENIPKSATTHENNESYNLDLFSAEKLGHLLKQLRIGLFKSNPYDSILPSIGISERNYENMQGTLIAEKKRSGSSDTVFSSVIDEAKKIIKRIDNRYFYKGENNEDRDERDQENSSNANRESGRMVSEWNEQGSDQGHRGYSGVTGSARSGTQNRYDDGESGHSERDSKELTKGRKGTSGNSSVSQRDGMHGESNNADIQSDISKDDFEFDPKKAAMMAAFFEKMNIN